MPSCRGRFGLPVIRFSLPVTKVSPATKVSSSNHVEIGIDTSLANHESLADRVEIGIYVYFHHESLADRLANHECLDHEVVYGCGSRLILPTSVQLGHNQPIRVGRARYGTAGGRIPGAALTKEVRWSMATVPQHL